jgi:hypothetical protein
MTSITFDGGQLQVDLDKGVIHYNDATGVCRLRISNLPTPIPDISDADARHFLTGGLLDINFGQLHTSWSPKK